MKYMGSKKYLLNNGLGELIKREIVGAKRFIDIFAGTGSVGIHVAENYNIKVHAYDLQLYSAILARAILTREEKINWEPLWSNWLSRAKKLYDSYNVPSISRLTKASVLNVRYWCAKQNELPITKAYGGHYFSASQAVWLDVFRKTLPRKSNLKTVFLSALIQAASNCAAAPGHTAQPFQPTRSAKPFLKDAWEKDIISNVKANVETISERFSKKIGEARVANANDVVGKLKEGDLVFIDPPYSGVHYSRFYHVLETIAKGSSGTVSGVGRYPEIKNRPRSLYSIPSESKIALDDLLSKIAKKKAKAIITFPNHNCSNGLSGRIVIGTASKYFNLKKHIVQSKFSTLGGRSNGENNVAGRKARHNANELILILDPKKI